MALGLRKKSEPGKSVAPVVIPPAPNTLYVVRAIRCSYCREPGDRYGFWADPDLANVILNHGVGSRIYVYKLSHEGTGGIDAVLLESKSGGVIERYQKRREDAEAKP